MARPALAAIVAAVLLAGCGTGGATSTPSTPTAPSTRPSAASSHAASTPSSAAPSDETIAAPAVVTFEVAGVEEFKVELVTNDLVAHAIGLRDGKDLAAIPIGTVVRDDPGVNAPWSWHLEPSTFAFADVTVEVCDGIPSYVEDGTVTSDQYCPWSARVVSVVPKAAP
jgi:hypothetical protein